MHLALGTFADHPGQLGQETGDPLAYNALVARLARISLYDVNDYTLRNQEEIFTALLGNSDVRTATTVFICVLAYVMRISPLHALVSTSFLHRARTGAYVRTENAIHTRLPAGTC